MNVIHRIHNIKTVLNHVSCPKKVVFVLPVRESYVIIIVTHGSLSGQWAQWDSDRQGGGGGTYMHNK
jgi:hypothetical protein